MTRLRPRRQTHRARAGFTLVEALITLLLVAVVLPFVMKGVSASAQLGVLADRRAEAGALADTRLAEAMLTGEWEEGDSAGEFDPRVYGSEAGGYTWYLLVEDWQSKTAYREVTVIVTWLQAGQEQNVALSTVVYAEAL